MATARCAPVPTEAPVDFGTTGCGARPFLERLGVLPAYRHPEPILVPGDLRIHRYPLRPPLPLATLQRPLLGQPAPDRGKSLAWPHPDLAGAEEVFPE